MTQSPAVEYEGLVVAFAGTEAEKNFIRNALRDAGFAVATIIHKEGLRDYLNGREACDILLVMQNFWQSIGDKKPVKPTTNPPLCIFVTESERPAHRMFDHKITIEGKVGARVEAIVAGVIKALESNLTEQIQPTR